MTRLLPLVLVALLSGCAVTRLVGYQLAPDYPDDFAVTTMKLEGLSQPASVTFDAQGVPHVEAKTLTDLALANGYVQGRARFFQMDMMRRLARGRVSEIVGEQPLVSSTTVEYDRTMRGWDIEGRSKADFGKLSAESKAVLEAFAKGVNQAMHEKTPIEYRLLGLEPTPWTPEDSLAVGLLNVWTITHNYQQETARLLFAMHLGVERMNAIYPSEPMRGGRTVQATKPGTPLPPTVAEELVGLFPVALAAPKPLAAFPVESLTSGGASNGWAVSGARTKSGKPMVANDPHLTHLLPGILLQMHLKGPDLDVIGATAPGLPWILGGHNARVAWAMTSAMSDVTDLVIEKVDPQAPGRVLHEGGDCPLTTRDEIIRARDGSEFKETTARFRATCNGPLANDLMPQLFPEGSPLVAIRWRVAGLERSMDVLLKLNRATSAEAFGREVAELPSTYNTWTVGDVDGHIGSFLSGEMPLRPNHRGTFPVPGWTSRYEWTEWVKGERVPHAMDPESGILAHANNTMLEPTAGDFERVQVDAAPSYRFDRIVSLLAATPKHDVQSFERVMADTYSIRGRELTPVFLAALGDEAKLSAAAKVAKALLAGWDFDARADRPEAAIFFLAYRNALVLALEDELPDEAMKFFLAQRYSTNTADLWFESATHPIWDDRRTKETETRDAVLRKAFTAAVEELAAKQGADPKAWRWGELHWHRPMHAFGSKSALDGTVNLAKMGAGGELDTVWKSHFDLGNPKAPFKTVAGPAYRSVVDLADPAHAWWVVDTGASGWPKSPHYGDQYEVWKKGELVPMLTDLAEIRRGAHGELTLVP
jgi:penicillin amidase